MINVGNNLPNLQPEICPRKYKVMDRGYAKSTMVRYLNHNRLFPCLWIKLCMGKDTFTSHMLVFNIR